MLKLRDLATSKGEKFVIKQALEKVDYAKFVMPDGNKNYFMYDNAYYAEIVKEFYQNFLSLVFAYKESNTFNFSSKSLDFGFTDSDRRALGSGNINRDEAFEFIIKLSKSNNIYDKKFLKDISKKYPYIYKAYKRLGEGKVRQIGLNRKVLQEITDQYNPIVIIYVYDTFKVDECYTGSYVKEQLQAICARFGLPYKTDMIKTYFKVHEQKVKDKLGKYQRGYRIVRRRFRFSLNSGTKFDRWV